MQSDDNQPRQDDESSQVEHTNGLYIDNCMEFLLVYGKGGYNVLV